MNLVTPPLGHVRQKLDAAVLRNEPRANGVLLGSAEGELCEFLDRPPALDRRPGKSAVVALRRDYDRLD